MTLFYPSYTYVRQFKNNDMTLGPSYTFCKHNGDRSKRVVIDVIQFAFHIEMEVMISVIIFRSYIKCVRRLLQFTLAYHTLFGSKTAASQKTALEKFRTQYLFTSHGKTTTLELFLCWVHAREGNSFLVIVRSFWTENSDHLKSSLGQFWM